MINSNNSNLIETMKTLLDARDKKIEALEKKLDMVQKGNQVLRAKCYELASLNAS